VFGGPTEAAAFCAASLGLSNVGSRDDITKQKSQDLDLGNYCLFLALLNTFFKARRTKKRSYHVKNGIRTHALSDNVKHNRRRRGLERNEIEIPFWTRRSSPLMVLIPRFGFLSSFML
jgi:hypothetical protein